MKRIKSMYDVMQNTLSQWGKQDRYTSIGEMSNTLTGWARDLENYAYLDGVTHEGIYASQEALKEGYFNRDSRDLMTAAAQKAVMGIKSAIDSQASNAPYKSGYTTSDRLKRDTPQIGFGGYDTNSEGYDPVEFSLLSQTITFLRGLRAQGSIKSYQKTDIRTLYREMSDLIRIYPDNSNIISRIDNVLGQLESLYRAESNFSDFLQDEGRALKSHLPSTQQRMRLDRMINAAIEGVDQLAVAIKSVHTLTNESVAMTDYDVDQLNRAIETIAISINNQSYKLPSVLLPRVKSIFDSVCNYLAPFDSVKIAQLTRSANESLERTMRAAAHPSVKSMNTYGWKERGVAEPFNNFLNDLSLLQEEINR